MFKTRQFFVILSACAWLCCAFAQPAPAPAPATPAPAPATPAPAAPAPAAPAPDPAAAAPAAAPAPAPAPPPPPKRDIQQVQIQSWISETGEQGQRTLGANLNYLRFVGAEERNGSVERVSTSLFDTRNRTFTVTVPAPDTNPAPDNLRPDQSGTLADGIQTQSGAGLVFNMIDTDRGTLQGLMRGIEQRSDVDLISKPELLVMNGVAAEVHAGQEVPYQSIDYAKPTQPSLLVKWEKLGVDIKLLPTVLSPNLIQIDLVDLSVSDRTGFFNTGGVDLPVFATRSQTGVVQIPNGQTFVIGGLSSQNVRKSEQRVPILGRVPLLGIPFRARNSEARKNNLLIFMSPTIVNLRELPPDAVSALDFWKEEKWRNQERIEREITVLEQEL
jgi:type II secretory pathway component GspD/PulD (secretin)